MRLAIGQMRVEPGNPTANLRMAAEMVRSAAADGADLIVLPEALDLGWTDESAQGLAVPIPGSRSDSLASAAREAGINVVAGLTESHTDAAGESRVYNTSVFFDRRGDLLGKHRKINILGIAREIYTPGNWLAPFETEFGTAGIPVCADCWPSVIELPLALGRMGARLFLSPSAWAVEPDFDNARTPYGHEWEESYTRIAQTFDAVVVGVSNVGRIRSGDWKGHPCIGNSLVVTPLDVVHRGTHGEDAEELIVMDVELPHG